MAGKEDAVQLHIALGKAQLQVSVLAHVLQAVHRQPLNAEQGARIVCAVGFQGGKSLHLAQAQKGRAGDYSIHLQAGDGARCAEAAAHTFIHFFPERRNVFFFDGKARGQLVAAETQQQFLALFQGGEQVEAAEAAAGTFAHLPAQMDHKTGAGIFLAQAGGHDATTPWCRCRFPAPARCDRTPAGRRCAPRPRRKSAAPPAGAPVEFAQFPGQFLRPAAVAGEKQFRRRVRLAHAPAALMRGESTKPMEVEVTALPSSPA